MLQLGLICTNADIADVYLLFMYSLQLLMMVKMYCTKTYDTLQHTVFILHTNFCKLLQTAN